MRLTQIAHLRRAVVALIPSLSDCVFIAVMGWMFLSAGGWSLLLGDGDTGWHIRTGEYILNSRAVPMRDLFSFSRAGAEWFSWEWLSDVIFALAHRFAGLRAVVLLSGAAIAATATVLFRHMIWRGANFLAALFLTLLALSASTIHFLARPHVFTLLLVAISAWIVDADRRQPTRCIWILPPLACIWANLHGGFLALFVLLGCLLIDAAAAWQIGRDAASLKRFRRYLALTAACFAATFLNPSGWRLHLHIARYLNSDWILRAVEEFHSPDFHSESMLQFEALLFAGLGAAALLLSKRRFYEALLLIFWSQAALRSVRHVPIYALIAAPIVASEASALWSRWTAGCQQRSIAGILRDLFDQFPAHCRRTTVWPAALCAFLLLSPLVRSWPRDFPDDKFPVAALERNSSLFSASRNRILTSDQWGDYLIYRFYPRQRVFIDGRSDFYGPSIGKDYVDMMTAQADWRDLMKRYDFNVALIPVDWALAELLRNDAGWRSRYRDKQAVLFERDAVLAQPL